MRSPWWPSVKISAPAALRSLSSTSNSIAVIFFGCSAAFLLCFGLSGFKVLGISGTRFGGFGLGRERTSNLVIFFLRIN